MHEDLIPPEKATKDVVQEALWRTEYDVQKALKDFGHKTSIAGVYSNVDVLRTALEDHKPDIVFNLLEEFDGNATYDHNVVSYLELRRVAYTGCNPRGLMLARDKALSKKILSYHRIPTPKFQIVPLGHRARLAKHLSFPVIVKSLIEEASLGIAQASVVKNEDQLLERIDFIHEQIGTDAILEEYIDGREFYVSIMGNSRLEALPVWELKMNKLKEEGVTPIATSKVKWSAKYREKYKIHSRSANIDDDLRKKITEISKRCYKRLGLNGYARLDLRATDKGEVFVIEANPNPGIARDEEFSRSAESAGSDYIGTLNKLLQLGLSWSKKRR